MANLRDKSEPLVKLYRPVGKEGYEFHFRFKLKKKAFVYRLTEDLKLIILNQKYFGYE